MEKSHLNKRQQKGYLKHPMTLCSPAWAGFDLFDPQRQKSLYCNGFAVCFSQVGLGILASKVRAQMQ